jgi:hypothetical protein
MGLEIRKIISDPAIFIGTCILRVKMDLESIVLYLNKKDLAAVEIHTEINPVRGEGTVGAQQLSATPASNILQILRS